MSREEIEYDCRTQLKFRRRSVFRMGLLFVGLAWASSAFATAPSGTFRGNVYGTFANVRAGPIAATLGRSAYLGCPCRGTGGKTLSNRVDSISAGHNGTVLKSDTLLSTVFTDTIGLTKVVKDTSKVSGLNLLNGLIVADAVTAVANTTAGATAINGDASGSTFLNLQIAGKAIPANVAPNTSIDLAGIGHVVLKGIVRSGNGKSFGHITVNMIFIHVTLDNSFSLPIGTQIIVGHASSGFSRTELQNVFAGGAWAAEANAAIGDLLVNSIGRAAFVPLGCEGTAGKTISNNIAALKAGSILALGTGVTTAFGGPTTTGPTAKTTATVQNVGLLNGMITASEIVAVAEEKIAGGVRTRSTKGSGLTGVKVLGLPLPLVITPNTKITLPLIGYVVLNQQTIPPAGSNAQTVVNGIHVVITAINVLHLPVGTEIIVSHAQAGATVQ